ncbi:MAG: citrate lyase holo-[acyl-carrier protein] synthase [Spirochaetaceae bacterium 4572_59]|nr:MAG: citrate lyase holo-[acyl-carrier protein] synthase [Spirochaetaceae bacterium 4572_59]
MEDNPVSLPEMLVAREQRAVFRYAYFSRINDSSSLLQITVNIPGSVKNSDMIRDIYREAIRAVCQLFPEAQLLPESSDIRKTGPEGYLSLFLWGEDIKRKTSLLEDSHILGRLWDIDVFTDPNHSLSRSEIGMTGRSCYLCERPAHECSRSKRHSLKEIQEYINNIYRQFSVGNP